MASSPEHTSNAIEISLADAFSARPPSAHCRRLAANSALMIDGNSAVRVSSPVGCGLAPEAEMRSRVRQAAVSPVFQTLFSAVPEPPVQRRSDTTPWPAGCWSAKCADIAWPAFSSAEPVASVPSGTRLGCKSAMTFKSRPFGSGTPESENNCASTGEVVVYQPERTAANPVLFCRRRPSPAAVFSCWVLVISSRQ